MNKKETKKWRSEDYIEMMGEPAEEELAKVQKILKAEKKTVSGEGLRRR